MVVFSLGDLPTMAFLVLPKKGTEVEIFEIGSLLVYLLREIKPLLLNLR